MSARPSLFEIAGALRRGEVTAAELTDQALAAVAVHDDLLQAYALVDKEGARAAARAADDRLAGGNAPPMCGVPVSVKDLYGMEGLPTFAGTPRRLPEKWSRDAWLVARLRAQGAVFTGKTHTVEMAYGGLGINPHWATPWNPWDPDVHRVPGGSSAGAGVSLWEGAALVALGSDTGGSIRIPASMTGTVGHRTTTGRWPTDGVVQLSHTLDTVGGLTRSVQDSLYFFAAVDPDHGAPEALLARAEERTAGRVRVTVPSSELWRECQPDIAEVLHATLDELASAGWRIRPGDGAAVDAAVALYFEGGIPGAECKDFLEHELPGWMDTLHPIVGSRLAPVPPISAPSYAAAMEERNRMEASAGVLFADADILAVPAAIFTPPRVADLEEIDRYVEANAATLRPTCWVGMLGLCALTLPVGRDQSGMPVGLQLVAPAGHDAELLSTALAAERILGGAEERLGRPHL